MGVAGGLRIRLIRDSLYQMVNDALTDLGWFDSGRQHKPVLFISEPLNPLTAIAPNTLGLGADEATNEEVELGSNLAEHHWMFWLEFMAEDTTVGLHLMTDLRDVLQGRFPSISRTTPSFPVWDYRQATPPILFYCGIETVALDMTHNTGQSWQATWYGMSFTVTDIYGDEDG